MADDVRLGVDIGGTSIKWTIIVDGEPIADGQVATPQEGPPSVVDAVARIARTSGHDGVHSVGVAIPGHINRLRGSTTLVPNIPGEWTGFPFVGELSNRHGITAALVNDARAFGIAELTIGAARGHERAVFVTIGTGIGGCIALDGAILRNDFDSIGEIGHVTVERDGDLCGCGNRGCAEAYAGVRALTARLPGLSASADPMASLRRRLDAGEPDAVRVLEDATWALASAVSATCVTLRIDRVVLGGGLGARWPEFAARIRTVLAQRENVVGPATVHLSQLGDFAGAIGAALSITHPTSPTPTHSEQDLHL